MESFSAQLSQSYQNLIEKLSGWLDAFILQLPNIVIAIIVALIAMLLSKYFRKLAVKSTRRFTQNKTVVNLMSNLAAVFFGLIVIFIILSILNLGSTINKILATAGVIGLAVGLALQDPMNNLFSGVFMSVRELYKIGDLVETNGYFGTIIDIDLRATKLRLPTGQEVIIPNMSVIQNPLKNYSVSGMRRVDVACGVSYGEDLDFVEEVAVNAVKSIDSVNSKMPLDLVYNEFGDSSINFIVRFWIDDITQRDYLIEQSKCIKALKKAFDANDIMIPFPIRTLDFGIKGGVPLNEMNLRVLSNDNKSQASNE